MENYLTALGESKAEYTEKRSKFIATLRHCETEEEALSFISEMRSDYWDARHNVFAYSVNRGMTVRFSDDGEPHGTAGKPILDVISGSEITDIAIVVTRYFGGVLLGTGGLVRAYSKAAKDAVSAADIAEMLSCTVFEAECDYSDRTRLVTLIETCGGTVEDFEYSDIVRISFYLRDSDCEPFFEKLSEAFSAKITAVEVGKRISPVKISKNL